MAAFEFQASLRMQLREAAEREQRRSPLARLAAAGRALLPGVGHSLLPAAAVAATIAATISVAAIFLMSDSAQRPVAPPEGVAELSVADSVGATFGAFGSVWMADTAREQLLRVDPDSRRVIGRLPVAGEVALGVGGGDLWALQEGRSRGGFALNGPLLRIDPSSNRVTARIALGAVAGQPFAGYEVLDGRDEVWVAGPGGALRIDARTNRVTQAVAAPDQLVSTHFALLDGDLWAITEDGRLLSFDTRTGRTVSDVRLGLPEAGDLSNGPGGALIATAPGALARIEPYSGRVLWRTRLGPRVDVWTAAGGNIWVRSSGQGQDRLSALDPDTGRVLTRVELEDFGGAGLAAVDDELWLSTVAGNVVVMRR
ncbi:MAG TPA: PQQ-binding-like beta-propeller repeat protein [Thermoleophilaceae bacterium]|nr:PQQ-binding-like beta-propeller repeat protein [Thermoleophilaceae bacterium]